MKFTITLSEGAFDMDTRGLLLRNVLIYIIGYKGNILFYDLKDKVRTRMVLK